MRWQSRTAYLDSIHTAWLRYDLDFRHKYSGAPMEQENLPASREALRAKHQPEPVNPPRTRSRRVRQRVPQSQHWTAIHQTARLIRHIIRC